MNNTQKLELLLNQAGFSSWGELEKKLNPDPPVIREPLPVLEPPINKYKDLPRDELHRLLDVEMKLQIQLANEGRFRDLSNEKRENFNRINLLKRVLQDRLYL